MISIIANFYKSESYIPKLISSVIKQSYQNWELICVNDCSPGDDLRILQQFASKDKRIRIINNSVNLGISKAKYIGIQEAKGEYLCFMDGDDWLESEALQKMIEPALKHNLDLVIMNHRKVLPIIGYAKVYRSNTDVWNKPIRLNPYDSYSDESRINFVKYYGHFFGVYRFNTAYWGKLIKKEIIEYSGFTPPAEQVGEDFYFGYTIFPYIRNLMFVDYVGYNWRWGGMTSGKKNNLWTGEKNIKRSNEIYEERLNLIKKYKMECYILDLMIEQRKNFVGFLSAEAKFNSNSDKGKKIIEMLEKVLEPEFYKDFKILQENNEKYFNDDLTNCLVNQDAKGVYEYCNKIYKSSFKKRILRSILHKILYPFAKI